MSVAYTIRRYCIHALRRMGLMPVVNCLNNFRFFLVKKYCLFVGKNPLESVYDDEFFRVSDQEYALRDSPKIFAKIIKENYNSKSAVDIGCGIGLYLRELEKLGIEIFGIDGSPAALRNLVIQKNKFLVQDATEYFSLQKQYDCAICFEVAEHIQTDKSGILVDNISRTSNLIFFAAAPPGQGGHDHINEQKAQFWIDKFIKKGYSFLAEDTANVRKLLSCQGVVFWLADNILIFRK